MKVCGASSGLSHEQLRRVTESHLGSAPTSRTKDFSGNFYASGSLQERVNEAKSSCTVLSSVYSCSEAIVKTLAQSLPPGPQEEEEERGSASLLLFFLCVSPLLDYAVARSHIVLLAPGSSSGS
ncbi:uncharacterized [Tachysurus ichikawai]